MQNSRTNPSLSATNKNRVQKHPVFVCVEPNEAFESIQRKGPFRASSSTAAGGRKRENEKGENQECRADASACARDDYIFEWAKMNPSLYANEKTEHLLGLFAFIILYEE